MTDKRQNEEGGRRPTNGQIIRFICLTLLWLLLCWMLVASQPFSLRVLFVVIASGIIVFVPVIKKYRRK